ncbi:hypothetical protein F5Y13DRAFT_84860 [Hypoxylon sp. FL1857]|nr:hypothetical protein F5Y13DRAFT_84860 [Hypoxylon sp. FL1857]
MEKSPLDPERRVEKLLHGWIETHRSHDREETARGSKVSYIHESASDVAAGQHSTALGRTHHRSSELCFRRANAPLRRNQKKNKKKTKTKTHSFLVIPIFIEDEWSLAAGQEGNSLTAYFLGTSTALVFFFPPFFLFILFLCGLIIPSYEIGFYFLLSTSDEQASERESGKAGLRACVVYLCYTIFIIFLRVFGMQRYLSSWAWHSAFFFGNFRYA